MLGSRQKAHAKGACKFLQSPPPTNSQKSAASLLAAAGGFFSSAERPDELADSADELLSLNDDRRPDFDFDCPPMICPDEFWAMRREPLAGPGVLRSAEWTDPFDSPRKDLPFATLFPALAGIGLTAPPRPSSPVWGLSSPRNPMPSTGQLFDECDAFELNFASPASLRDLPDLTAQLLATQQIATPSPQPVELPIDAAAILEFLLGRAEAPTGVEAGLTGLFVELYQTQRTVRPLRKEQKIKKVLNFSFKNMIRRFSEERTRDRHVREETKRLFFERFFEAEHVGRAVNRPTFKLARGRQPEGSFLTYNKRFFQAACKSAPFVAGVRENLSDFALPERATRLVERGLRKLLKKLAAFAARSPADRRADLPTVLRDFFGQRNCRQQPKTLKLPWSIAEVADAVRVTRKEFEKYCALEEKGRQGKEEEGQKGWQWQTMERE